MYIKEKTLTAIRDVAGIQKSSKQPLEASMKLFDLEIVQVVTYGLRMILEYLGENNLTMLESVEATYL
jgi:hypothetical protein